jgi:amino acid adenylation domain-containing protein
LEDLVTRSSASTQNLCLHERFAAQAADRSDRVALRFGSDTLTYAELNRRANRLAHHLRSLGVGPDALVGISCQRSPESIVAILGVLKAGGAYVPLDPDHPAERLQFLIEDSGLEILVASPELDAVLPAGGPRRVLLDRQLLEEGPDDEVASGVAPENLAYVIYTSGSTGKPKGVLIEHRNVTRLFSETRPWYGFDENDSWTLFHSIGFDFSVWEIWGPLLHGGCLVGVSRELTRDPGAFLDFLSREGITMLSQTPSAFRQIVEAEGRRDERLPLSLRWVVFGGEALELGMLAPWFERRGDDSPRIANMYGITETTVHVTYREIRRGETAEPGRSPIGQPIPDLTVHLLDSFGKPVPPGTPGEMCVGGAGVARGYLNRPELTLSASRPPRRSSAISDGSTIPATWRSPARRARSTTWVASITR